MNVIEGLRANYQGKVLARAIRVVKEQGKENQTWKSIEFHFLWEQTDEGWEYWNSVFCKKPNPDNYLPKNYVDVEHVSLINEVNNNQAIDSIGESESETSFGKLMSKDAMEQTSSKVIAPKAVRDGLVNKTEEAIPWTSVDKRLPDHEKNVLAVLDGEVCVMAYFSFKEGGEKIKVWGIVYDGLNGDPIYDDNYYPTLWMEIPKKPNTINS